MIQVFNSWFIWFCFDYYSLCDKFVLDGTSDGKPPVVKKSGAFGDKTDVVQMPGLLIVL